MLFGIAFTVTLDKASINKSSKLFFCNLEASKVTLTVHFLQSNLQKWFPAAFIIEEHEPTVFRNLLLAVEARAAPLTDGS